MTSTFCPIPWLLMGVQNKGDFRICCNTRGNEGILRKSDGTEFKTSIDSFKDAKNAQLAKDVRLSMLSGDKHPVCKRCWVEEKNGVKSKRDWELLSVGQYLTEEEAIELTQKNGVINSDPIYYDLRFGNLCNLKCVMCHPVESTAWIKDYAALGNDVSEFQTTEYDWYLDKNFWLELECYIPHVKQLYLAGGEPFLIKQHFDFLQKCVEQGYAKNITLEYNSNITNIPDKAFAIWKEFKLLKIGCSIDGIGSVNNYIRFPSKWEDIETNLRKLDSLDNSKIGISPTISIYNVLNLPEIIEWVIDANFNKKINVSGHLCHNPDYMNIKALPLEIKKQVIKKYTNFLPRIERSNSKYFKERANELLTSYIKHMMSEDWVHLFPKFLKYVKDLENIRGNSLEESIPELYHLIKEI